MKNRRWNLHNPREKLISFFGQFSKEWRPASEHKCLSTSMSQRPGNSCAALKRWKRPRQVESSLRMWRKLSWPCSFHASQLADGYRKSRRVKCSGERRPGVIANISSVLTSRFAALSVDSARLFDELSSDLNVRKKTSIRPHFAEYARAGKGLEKMWLTCRQAR